MFTVNELAIQTNTAAHVVRYYLRIGLIQASMQQPNGYRLFSSADASRLRFIRMAKQLGFTLSEIRTITEHAELGESPCEDVRRIVLQHIVENRAKIDEMTKLQTRMESALEQWELMPDGTPDGNSICHLIESIEGDEDVEKVKSSHSQKTPLRQS